MQEGGGFVSCSTKWLPLQRILGTLGLGLKRQGEGILVLLLINHENATTSQTRLWLWRLLLPMLLMRPKE